MILAVSPRCYIRKGTLVKARILLLIAGLASLLTLPTQTRATWSPDFEPLLTELESRALTLGNSTDRTEQKQFRAVAKSVGALNNVADSLEDDLKTAGKIAGSLEKAFPEEFLPTN